jgi:hypothetical protein
VARKYPAPFSSAAALRSGCSSEETNGNNNRTVHKSDYCILFPELREPLALATFQRMAEGLASQLAKMGLTN